jgi:hypothetical protein
MTTMNPGGTTRSRLAAGAIALALGLSTAARAERTGPAQPAKPASPVPSSPLPPAPAIDACAGIDTRPLDRDVEATMPVPRDALKYWLGIAGACPNTGAAYRVAAAHALVGRAERSAIHFESAIAGYKKILDGALDADDKRTVESRLGETNAALHALRAAPLLIAAREASARDDYASALDDYDRYLAEAPKSSSRSSVERERAQRLEQYRKQYSRQESRRAATGSLLLIAGAGAMAGGGVLVWMAQKDGNAAPNAATVGAHNSAIHDAVVREVAGGALIGVGAVAFIGGIYRLATGGHKRPSAARAMWVTPTANGLAAGGSF